MFIITPCLLFATSFMDGLAAIQSCYMKPSFTVNTETDPTQFNTVNHIDVCSEEGTRTHLIQLNPPTQQIFTYKCAQACTHMHTHTQSSGKCLSDLHLSSCVLVSALSDAEIIKHSTGKRMENNTDIIANLTRC